MAKIVELTNSSRWLLITAGAVSAVCFFFLGFWVSEKSDVVSTFENQDFEHRQLNTSYKFVSPLLECEEPKATITGVVRRLEKEINKYVLREKAEGVSSHISVYYRDLSNGPWFGIDEDEEFLPASLAKVPVMMSLLSAASKDPLLLQRQVLFEQEYPFGAQYFKPSTTIEVGQQYSVQELIAYMITQSDNQAMSVLSELPLPDGSSLDDVFNAFGIPVPRVDGSSKIDVRTYSSFFRVLYNATYLPPYYSEAALGLLSQTVFNKGLRAGVPMSIPVAHKFGERVISDTGEKQLHDCGIVYYPRRPYILCVMTRGDSFDELTGVISQISRLVYHDLEASE